MTKKSKEATKEITEVKPQKTNAERFNLTVQRLLEESTGHEMRMTEQQRRLVQNYFIGIDAALQKAEQKRTDKARPPYIWQNVDLQDLAVQVRDSMRLGLDMLIPNHVHAIPYLDERSGKYVVNLMTGYIGMTMLAIKYALDPPKNIIIELVRETDKFTVLKKSSSRNVEGYEFELTEMWNRGEIVGGFGYLEYDDPTKNRVILMSAKDLKKRKPKNASQNFWGTWENEMMYKTLVRNVCNNTNVPRDPTKIDDAYNRQMLRELKYAELEARDNIERASIDAEFIDITDDEPPMIELAGESVEEVVEEVTVEEAVGEEEVPFEPQEGDDVELPFTMTEEKPKRKSKSKDESTQTRFKAMIDDIPFG
jgi:recombination protein RecT